MVHAYIRRQPDREALEAKLKKVQRASQNPENKWEERDREWLYAAEDILNWVLGYKPEEPKSPEAGV